MFLSSAGYLGRVWCPRSACWADDRNVSGPGSEGCRDPGLKGPVPLVSVLASGHSPLVAGKGSSQVTQNGRVNTGRAGGPVGRSSVYEVFTVVGAFTPPGGVTPCPVTLPSTFGHERYPLSALSSALPPSPEHTSVQKAAAPSRLRLFLQESQVLHACLVTEGPCFLYFVSSAS